MASKFDNPCSGTGKEAVRFYRTPMSLGSKFGGKRMGMCPDEGCESFVTSTGKMRKHNVRAGEYMRNERARAAEPKSSVDPNDPRHLD